MIAMDPESFDNIRDLPADDQMEVMEEWFRDHYESPDEQTPWDSEEGDYVWIWGGPYDPREELEAQFGGRVPGELIEKLAENLSDQYHEWAGIPSETDYDHTFFEAVTANKDALATFDAALEKVRLILDEAQTSTHAATLCSLLYANVITSLETYLSDTFINTVLADDELLRRFIETTPEFKDRTFRLSEVFRKVDEARTDAKKYLLDVVWHNLAKVLAMYRDTLGINFGDALKIVGKAIPYRHDIVHRNGRRKDGSAVVIGRNEVMALLSAANNLVHRVEQQYTNRAVQKSLKDSPF